MKSRKLKKLHGNKVLVVLLFSNFHRPRMRVSEICKEFGYSAIYQNSKGLIITEDDK